MFKKLKDMINRFLAKLEKANEASFGNKELDCCKLNKNTERK